MTKLRSQCYKFEPHPVSRREMLRRSSAGFGSLALSTHRGTATMGELLTIGVGLTLICTLLVLPALLPAAKEE